MNSWRSQTTLFGTNRRNAISGKTGGASANGKPGAQKSLLAIAQLLETMAKCPHGINEKVLEAFSSDFDIALSFCTMDARLAALLKSLPTLYLSNAMMALREGNVLKAECRSATVGLQQGILPMKSADDLANVLRDMSTDARLETASPEVEGKYEVLSEAFRQFDFSSLEEGTSFSYT